jgi:hypothetical protein
MITHPVCAIINYLQNLAHLHDEIKCWGINKLSSMRGRYHRYTILDVVYGSIFNLVRCTGKQKCNPSPLPFQYVSLIDKYVFTFLL